MVWCGRPGGGLLSAATHGKRQCRRRRAEPDLFRQGRARVAFCRRRTGACVAGLQLVAIRAAVGGSLVVGRRGLAPAQPEVLGPGGRCAGEVTDSMWADPGADVRERWVEDVAAVAGAGHPRVDDV